jgi:hypothetical protein
MQNNFLLADINFGFWVDRKGQSKRLAELCLELADEAKASSKLPVKSNPSYWCRTAQRMEAVSQPHIGIDC